MEKNVIIVPPQTVVLVLARCEARSLQDVRPEAAGHGKA